MSEQTDIEHHEARLTGQQADDYESHEHEEMVNGDLTNYEILVEKYDPNYEPLPEQVQQYAEFLGMDLSEDFDLLYIARNGLKEPLPKGWQILRQVDTQKIIYFNQYTSESREEDPRDLMFRQLFMEAKAARSAQRQAGNSPSLAPSTTTPSKGNVNSPGDFKRESDDHDEVEPSPAKPASLDSVRILHATESFRRQQAQNPFSTISVAKSDGRPATLASDDGSTRSSLTVVSPPIPRASLPTLTTARSFTGRSAMVQSSLTEEDVESLEDIGNMRDMFRRTPSIKDVTVSPKNKKQSSSNGGLGSSSAINTTPSAAAPSSSSGSSSAQGKESRDSRHREIIKRIEAEITVLREDIVETRKYADSASARATQAHADCLKAESRARLAEEESSRLRNELGAVVADGERRRQLLKDELDDTVKRLITAENARDMAERKVRQVMLEESARMKHMEKEMELLRAKLSRVLRENEEKEKRLISGERPAQPSSSSAPLAAAGNNSSSGSGAGVSARQLRYQSLSQSAPGGHSRYGPVGGASSSSGVAPERMERFHQDDILLDSDRRDRPRLRAASSQTKRRDLW